VDVDVFFWIYDGSKISFPLHAEWSTLPNLYGCEHLLSTWSCFLTSTKYLALPESLTTLLDDARLRDEDSLQAATALFNKLLSSTFSDAALGEIHFMVLI